MTVKPVGKKKKKLQTFKFSAITVASKQGSVLTPKPFPVEAIPVNCRKYKWRLLSTWQLR